MVRIHRVTRTCQIRRSAYDARMDPLLGTRNCPHLGFESREGRPCCRADESVRVECGRSAPNPKARGRSEVLGLAAHFCTVLGQDAVPAEALRLAAHEKAEAARRQQPRRQGYRPPGSIPARPAAPSEPGYDPATDQPVIPTHILRDETQRPGPNSPCPCGSGRKYKKCCGRR